MAVTLKTAEDIAHMRVACRLASEVLDYITPFVKAGVSTGEINRLCHAYMRDVQGTVPAPLNYAPPGYPPFITSELPPPASLAELKAAAVAQPGALQAQLNYAAALVADGQRRAAIDAFDAALAVDPGSLDARVGRIIAGYSKDNPAAAFGQMGPLVRDNPSDPSPRLHLALMLLWLRDPETARAEFRQVATLAPDTRLGRTAQQFLDAL